MASALSHAVAAAGIGAVIYRRSVPAPVWITGIACSVIPDVDVIGFRFGIHYGDFWGHRGFTHSLFFGVILAVAAAATLARLQAEISRASLFAYFFLSTASHGLLDAMTNGGLGVAFFSPLDDRRYFLPWRPILVSPIGVTRFFSHRGLAVLQTEILWIWLPSLVMIATVMILRRLTAGQTLHG
jgi:inner membrane protein